MASNSGQKASFLTGPRGLIASPKARLFAVIALPVLAVDLVTKLIGLLLLAPGEWKNLAGGTLAFGLRVDPTGSPWFLSIGAAVLAGFLFVLRFLDHRPLFGAFSLAAAGYLANYVNRIYYQDGVIDWFQAALLGRILPIGNAADLAQAAGWVAVALGSFRFLPGWLAGLARARRLAGTVEQSASARPAPDPRRTPGTPPPVPNIPLPPPRAEEGRLRAALASPAAPSDRSGFPIGPDAPDDPYDPGETSDSETDWLLADAETSSFTPGTPRSCVLGHPSVPGTGGKGAMVSPLVNRILFTAVEKGATHVLIKPLASQIEVSFLIDGVLVPAMRPPIHLRDNLVREIKALSSLDPALSRVPQSGVVKLVTDLWERHCRVRVLPTRQGEQIGLSLMDRILH